MATNASFKPIDPTRDEFRRYLERSGVIEALTKVVCNLVKDRPDNPLEYLRKNICDAKHQADEYAYLQKELEEAQREIQRLRKLIENAEPDALLEEKSNAMSEDKAKESAILNESTSSQEANESSSSDLEKIEENINDANKKLEDLKLN